MDDDAPSNGGYRLTAAEILYTQPSQPHLLESFVWQDYDSAPDYPELRRFLRFWASHLDIPLHSVRIANLAEARPDGMVYADYSTTVH
ncbi:MAG: Usg family protein [Telmatospirillum sp.]|nr:Usg family protein [Telmatospirillum sp.]